MADHPALAEAVRYLRSRGQNELADGSLTQISALHPKTLSQHPGFVVEDEDEAWKQAAGAVAWKAIVDARARAGRPVE
jgi:hypothetical protein